MKDLYNPAQLDVIRLTHHLARRPPGRGRT
jgi:hypothetical protein